MNTKKTVLKSATILVGGCFDILHVGHIQFLKEAKKNGSFLIVALESDRNVRERKGELRPIHTQLQRKQMLEALKFVDKVVLLNYMTTDADYQKLVHSIKPNIIALTQGDPYLTQKTKQASSVGATIAVIPHYNTPSTSQLTKLIGLE